MKRFDKQPSDVLDYDIDLSEWLTDGDNVIGANVSADPGISVDSTVISDDRVKIWLSGGTDGQTYKITSVINTEDGRTKEYDFQVKVKDQ